MSEQLTPISTIERPLFLNELQTAPDSNPGPLASLGREYLGSILDDNEVPPTAVIASHEDSLLPAIHITGFTVRLNPEEERYSPTKFIEVSMDQQLEYVDKVRGLLGDQATFDLTPIDIKDDSHNLAWLEAISQGHWPIAMGGSLEGHDRSNHHDALVYSPPEQAILVTAAAGYAHSARLAGKDIIIPARFGGSKRGATHDSNFLGHLDNVTEGLGGLSPQTKGLLSPLMDTKIDFGQAIEQNTKTLLGEIEDYLSNLKDYNPYHGGNSFIDELNEKIKISADLALALGSLETITLATQDRDATADEIKIALYGVIKGYIKTAAKLRGEPVPEGALDFWPTDDREAPMTKSVEELLFELGGGDMSVIDPRLAA